VDSEEFKLFARYESNQGIEIAKILDELPAQSLNMQAYRIKKA
jgi:hypothetical protein